MRASCFLPPAHCSPVHTSLVSRPQPVPLAAKGSSSKPHSRAPSSAQILSALKNVAFLKHLSSFLSLEAPQVSVTGDTGQSSCSQHCSKGGRVGAGVGRGVGRDVG